MRKVILMFAAVAIVRTCAFAVDGQVLINQSTLSVAGGTYTITQPGSYKLSGNLIAKDENTDVIVIAADHVTIDLNGFAILGPTNCAGGRSPCVRSGSGRGIATAPGTPRFNITIRNGSIQGMGARGIELFGDTELIEQMHVRSNGGGGIWITPSDYDGGSIVQYSTIELNGGSSSGTPALFVQVGLVHHNTVSLNLRGIEMVTGTVSDNVVNRNSTDGLHLFSDTSYKGNALQGNGINVVGGTNLGQNLCNNVACPGAVI